MKLITLSKLIYLAFNDFTIILVAVVWNVGGSGEGRGCSSEWSSSHLKTSIPDVVHFAQQIRQEITVRHPFDVIFSGGEIFR